MSFLRRHSGNVARRDADDQLPIRDYDRLDPNRVTEQHRLSQSELACIEDYERSHRARQEVLDKLRYLRGSEPLRDYDALDATQIAAALTHADVETLSLVREYELKFRRRDGVLDALARLRQAGRPSRRA
jgi:hypothetical protein